MIPEKSTFTCTLEWQGNVDDYDSFPRVHQIGFPGGQSIVGGGAHNIQNPRQTNPEELFAASVATCMMMTILAICARSKVKVTAYRDTPEALLELVERRYKITRVTLRPSITIAGKESEEKLATIISKAHANCFISLSVKSDVVVEPEYRFVD